MSEQRQGSFFANLFLGAIRFYQRNISPLFKPHCIYRPTCSEYAVQAIQKYGVKREVGLLLSVLLAVTLFIREDTIPFRKRNAPEEICGIGLLTFYTQS